MKTTLLALGFGFLSLMIVSSMSIQYHPRGSFIRGDTNINQNLDWNDGVYIINYLFYGGGVPKCMDAADWNDDGVVDISDAIGIFNSCRNGYTEEIYTFDETNDSIDCRFYP